MTSVRTAKSKGNTFEYDVEYNLKKIFPNIKLLERRGFVTGMDLKDESRDVAVECKFHKAISWNELVGYYNKLTERSKMKYNFVVFKTNRQPVLVYNGYSVTTFTLFFGYVFEKRPKGHTRGVRQ